MMKWFGMTAALVLVVGLSACTGDTPDADPATDAPVNDAAPAEESKEGSDSAKMEDGSAALASQTVDVACGVCIYKMDGKGEACPIAAKIGDATYLVQYADGAKKIDTHGAGLCKADTAAQAKVVGEVKDGAFVVSSLELIGS